MMEMYDFGGVITVCNDKEQEWESRSKARKYFLEAVLNSEGEDREKYKRVYWKIVAGYSYCTDSEDG